MRYPALTYILLAITFQFSTATELQNSICSEAPVDSTLVGTDILEVMPSRLKGDAATVSVQQSDAISLSLRESCSRKSEEHVKGFRVRIYFSNSQNARTESANTEQRFREAHPDCPVYRSFSNSDFKVTAGDFQSKSEALALKAAIAEEFPSAFIVMENINPGW